MPASEGTNGHIGVGSETVDSILSPFELSQEQYGEVSRLLKVSIEKGLHPDTCRTAAVKCLPSYVRAVPDGQEVGEFLALDLGGTNFRVLMIRLAGSDATIESQTFSLPQEIINGTGVMLFDHIAQCMHTFMTAQNLLDKALPLGFTFSFPCKQTGLGNAILMHWDKGFNVSGVEGEDIVKMLHDAIKQKGGMSKVECVAVVNDTVGTLISCAHADKKCAIGLILGTGSNASYIERLSEVKKWDGDFEDPQEVIINLEWGAFGDDRCLDFIDTDMDKIIDKESSNPGGQIFEKKIGGLYLGEICRLIFSSLIKNGHLFGGVEPKSLSQSGCFLSEYVSEIDGDDAEKLEKTEKILTDLNVSPLTHEDCTLVRRVCRTVSTRAAYLASAGIACLLNKMGRQDVTVGIDGSLYKCHPYFNDLMSEKIRSLTDPSIKFKLMFSSDGSGKGAALVAAVANRLRLNRESKKQAA